MNNLQFIFACITVIGVLISIYVFFIKGIERKIENKISKPEFVKLVADRVRLAFLIFNEDQNIICDYNAYENLNSIEVIKNDKNELIEIIIKPKTFLKIDPIIECITEPISFSKPLRINAIDLKYTVNGPDYIGGYNQKGDYIKKFKLTIIQ